MEPEIFGMCEEIDAACFSGDALEDPRARELLAHYIGRWTRRLAEYQEEKPE